jgi:hypothetical protein
MADAAARATAATAAPAPAGPTPAGSADTDAGTASTSAAASDTAASAPKPTRGRGGRRAPPSARAAPSGLEDDAKAAAGDDDDKPEASTAAGPPAAEAGTAAREGSNPPPSTAADPLDPARFSHIAARTYTPAAVEAATAAVRAAAPPCLAGAPNAKMFLRAFWYRGLSAHVVAGGPDAMHVYTLAAFFLGLALLDAGWAGTPASLAAAGALSLALEVCGGEGGEKPNLWPAELQAASGHAPGAVAAQRSALRRVQAQTPAPHLRRVWAAHHAGHGYAEFKEEWDRVLGVMAEAGEV